MEPRRDDLDLTSELRALRPVPRPEFAVKLDRRVEAGFPRRESDSASLFERLTERLRTVPPRRLLAPAGALALTAIVVATAIVATSDHGASPPLSFQAKAPDEISSPVKPAGVPAGAERQPKHANGAASAGGSSGTQYSEAPPVASEESQSGHAASGVQPSSSGAGSSGPFASHANHREIERAAQIVLGADPANVRSDAAKVFDAVHAADGIVLRSSIVDGAAGEAGANFDLLIPSGKLGDTLAAFSSIDEVLSRHESTQDITAPTIGIGERLRDSRAKIEGLLAQLATTTTDAERAAVEAELHAERARATALRSRLADLSRRANLSRVSLRIETGDPSAGAGNGGAWGIGDGLHDAGRILAIAAGVTMIGLAVIAPLALLLLLAWFLHRTWIRNRREQALSRRV
jgi:hypothetical protein